MSDGSAGPTPLRVVVSGAAGRMGATVCGAIEEAEGLELTGRADPALGTDLADVLPEADVCVDFTTPEAAPGTIRQALQANVHAVVGTTGFDLEPIREIAAGSRARCLVVPNFAIGAVLMMEACARIARHMPDCEIVEMHHDAKRDTPSGTASRTASLIAEAGGNVHDPIHSVRLPGLVAHQAVMFGGLGQTVTVRHDSTDRRSFMPGVVLACRRVPFLSQPLMVGLEHVLD